MSKKHSIRGSQPEEAYVGDLEDALMLNEPGTIVEPDIRKALLKYFRDMKMLEGAYLSKGTETRVNTQQRESTVKITRRQLNQIIKQEQASLISEMPVSTARGYFSRDIETRRPELRRLADEIDSVFQDWGIVADVVMFDSGYQGVTMEFVGKDGSKNKWMVVDQPGVVGPEDQSTGYIFFGPFGSAQKENAWVWESPGRRTRRYGDVDIKDHTRQRVYDMILEVIYDMLRGPMGSGTTTEGENMKITENQLRKIIAEEMPHARPVLDKNVDDSEFPIVVGYKLRGENQSEIAYSQDELDDIINMISGGPGSRANIPYSLNSLSDIESATHPIGMGIELFPEGSMKITEAQLRQIVRESSMIGAAGNAEDERIHKVMVEMVDAMNGLNAASRMLRAQDPFERGIINKLGQMQDVIKRYLNELDEREE